MRTILVLGAGLIARPLLRFLLTRYEYRVIVATIDVPRAQALMGDHPRGEVVKLDARDSTAAAALIGQADLVVSLLPAEFNPAVARLCVAHRRHFVSTSYVAPEMAALDDDARRAGVLLLNEMGLDPGIDHMSAAAIVRRLSGFGGRVIAFQSCCGGFPAFDANTNPWGYKFSWSPQAVMQAGRQPARYLRSGEVVEVRGGELFATCWPYELEGLGVFEVYPNRDALKYISPYRLDGVESMFRGTIRYPGWCATMRAAAQLGLFDVERRDWPAGTTYAEFIVRLVPTGRSSAPERVAEFVGVSVDSEVIARLEWAGLFSDRPIPLGHASPLEIFGNRLMKLMMYQPGERDQVVLKHLFTVAYPDGSKEEIRAMLVQTGESWGDSAMARTVSLPAAVAADLVLSNGVGARGVQIPVLREIYEPVLEVLEYRGIVLRETHIKSFPSPV